MENLYDAFVHAMLMKIEARLCNELECVYKDITNKIVEKKGKLTNEDVIEFQKKLQEVYDTNADIREKITGIKDTKKCILTKEACEELIKRLSVINIKEDEQAKNDRVGSHL
jgi:hypothetical protein|nr:MAG TPA_asm: hypothetical protein [Caudoviricetes sp.]